MKERIDILPERLRLQEARIKGNPLAEILLRYPCPQKILMVTDGNLNFGAGFFGLSEFVSIIEGAGHTVSRAHRSGGNNATIPGAFNFATAATAVTTANYDQLWLFGFSTTAISAAEQTTIAQFMQAGGGVFATGDHATIGSGMGTNIPRVREMRNWSSIPMTDPERHDTVINPGADAIKQFDDQADPIAQPMYPVFFSNGGAQDVASTWSVHPVLRHASGAVDCLPDHPHESECLAPTPVAGNFAGVEQWPAPIGGGARIAPVVVGVTMSAGRFITDIPRKPPVRPHSFGAISAYDGDAAHVGRIVCDATWHHFVNINLNGAGATPDTTGTPRTGLYVGGVATPEYEKIQCYYLNTVRWLAPRGRRNCWPFIKAALARFDPEMMEVELPHPHPCPWDPMLHIGRIAEGALTRQWGPGALEEVVDDLLGAGQNYHALSELLKPQQNSKEPSLLPLADLRRAVLGAMVNEIAHHLPADEQKLADVLEGGHDQIAAKIVPAGLRSAGKAINEHLERALKRTEALVRTIREAK